MSEVKVGQHWRSRDRRDTGSNERIVEVTEVRESYVALKNVKTGKVTRVLINRMKPDAKGFELVKDVEREPPKTDEAAA